MRQQSCGSQSHIQTLEIKLYPDPTIVNSDAGFKLLAVLQYYTERFIYNCKSVILENSVYQTHLDLTERGEGFLCA